MKMINIQAGQELKMTVGSVDTFINAKNKTIRYLDPLAANTTAANVTNLAKDLFANSQNTYKTTRGTIELGYFDDGSN